MIDRHYGHAPTGQHAAIDAQFVQGQGYSILPAMTIDDYISTHIAPESVQGADFFDFIVEDVVCCYFSLLFCN